MDLFKTPLKILGISFVAAAFTGFLDMMVEVLSVPLGPIVDFFLGIFVFLLTGSWP